MIASKVDRAEEASEDFSAAELSETNEQDMKKMEEVVKKIAKESRTGKATSAKIMDEINPYILNFFNVNGKYEGQKHMDGLKIE